MTGQKDRLDPFRGLEGGALIAALRDKFGDRLALVSSFGAEAAVLLHMAAGVDRSIPVLFVDTGKHFWQTRYYRAQLVDLLGLSDVRVISPDSRRLMQEDPSNALSASDPDACC